MNLFSLRSQFDQGLEVAGGTHCQRPRFLHQRRLLLDLAHIGDIEEFLLPMGRQAVRGRDDSLRQRLLDGIGVLSQSCGGNAEGSFVFVGRLDCLPFPMQIGLRNALLVESRQNGFDQIGKALANALKL